MAETTVRKQQRPQRPHCTQRSLFDAHLLQEQKNDPMEVDTPVEDAAVSEN